MTDTQPPAPTDAELDELRQANSGRLNFVTFSEFRVIARAVLEKWGSQPVACEPLTTSQIREWWASENGLEDCEMCKLEDFLLVVRAVEEKHGIKGGQHGADK